MALKEIPAWRRWIGRSRRVEFWASIVALYVLDVVLILATRQSQLVSLGSLIFWLPIVTRRLNDMRAGWWWAWVPIGSGFVIGFVAGLLRVAGMAIPAQGLAIVIGLITIGLVIWLGSAPGKADKVDAAEVF